MADVEETGREAARTGEAPPAGDASSDRPRRRRPLFIVLGIVVTVVVYAIAFEQTQVSLEPITSETRQRSLTNILRALARPDLVTYATEESRVSTEIAVPCGPPVAAGDRLSVTPECASPGETVTVTGSGFEPRQDVDVEFIPDSEFDITLQVAEATVDAEGTFASEVTIPDRVSETPQRIEAVTEEPIGSWGDRVEIYTDANENGVEDDPIIDASGTYRIRLPGSPDVPAVALLDPTNEIVQFVTAGGSFDAIDGPARGQPAIPLDEEEPSPTDIRVTGIGDGGAITIDGPPGADLSNWRASLYEATTGEEVSTTAVSDTIELSPRVSDTVFTTWDKILETVFLALVATTAGLLLAVPLSFIAARNIMREISVTVTNLTLILLGIPAGVAAGVFLARGAIVLVDPISTTALGSAAGLVVAASVTGLLVRAGIAADDTTVPSRSERLRRGGLLVLAGATGLVSLLLFSRLLQQVGAALAPALGPFGFIGTFFADIGEILDVAIAVIAALATAGLFANVAGRIGYAVRTRSARPLLRVLNSVLAAAAGALWAVLVAQAIDWFYQLGDPTLTVAIPAAVGAVLGLLVAWRGMARGEVDIGLSVYYAARTVFNTLRSIEPLVMAIVFVVWVGLGPFAGSLALALHTAAALAKLYSEQVESISTGPIEAVRATGANRLQTIVYSVVPQIVPPYISFTMYRWDINVRMSTIIGFVGGGGIGSILQQNINLLDYRAASVQMLAIAIVVASMDYASSRLRERYV